ncbi:MAG: membrane protein insertion efficiency factor YidD [Acidobacteria bacterium]|nr:membrane protein insertion efficiency factor YidD [Acidobacteriota bacterium]
MTTLLGRPLVGAIRLYQRFVSPLLGARCRFVPSCSEYAAMAIEEWGALRGTLLALGRLVRCHPFCTGGLDLPPRR